jgi:hypothetical protein
LACDIFGAGIDFSTAELASRHAGPASDAPFKIDHSVLGLAQTVLGRKIYPRAKLKLYILK